MENYLYTFIDTLFGHAFLAIYLFTMMDARKRRMLKKLPVLLLSPVLAAATASILRSAFPNASIFPYCLYCCMILLMCTLWAQWAAQISPWQAFAAVCMSGMFQVAVACSSLMLFRVLPFEDPPKFALTLAIHTAATLAAAALLRRLRFGTWFMLLLEEGPGPRRTALLLFAMEAAMEAFYILQSGIQPVYLIPYYLLVIAMAALAAGLVLYLARWLDGSQKLEIQRNVIAQQRLYEQDLESVRREVRSFRHDYKNLLAGLTEQARSGETDRLCAALTELDALFDRRMGEKIWTSVQIGNLRIPQVRGLILSKLAAMRERGVDCRLEVLYPVEQVAMDPWDFVRCLGILLDNAAEAALETARPWVEISLLAQEGRLSLRLSNPYAGIIDPDRIWKEGFSTKGEGRGLGLPGYQRILAEYPNAACSTAWAGGVFVQDLTVGAPS